MGWLRFQFPEPPSQPPTHLSEEVQNDLWGGGGAGCLDHKMPVVAYGVMFRANKDLFTLVGFIDILDPVNGIFALKNDHLQC